MTGLTMKTHIRWWLCGSVADIVEWQWDNPTLPSVPVPLAEPERLYDARINPWDQIVYLESYYEAPFEVRNEIRSLLDQAADRGRQL